MTDFLDEKRDEIDGRLAELRPLVEEYNRLLAASAALRGVDGSSGIGVGVLTSAPSPEQVDVSVSMSDGATVADAENEAPSPPVPAAPAAPDPDPAPVRRGPGRPRGSVLSKSREDGEGVSSGDADDAGASLTPALPSNGPRRAGRPKGSGTRAAEALGSCANTPE